MQIITLTVGELQTNCYIAHDDSGRAVVIDPGAEPEHIIRRCRSEDLRPDCIINTHAHADHIGATARLKEHWPEAELCIGHGDAPRLDDPVRNLGGMFGLRIRVPRPDRRLRENETVGAGAVALRVIETPGHTPGSICLVADAEDPQIIFCGDLIFADGVGRTDLPGGSSEALRDSIHDKIMRFADETVLLPGHGPSTTVGDARKASWV